MATVLVINSWAGRREIPIEILGETRTKFRVKLLADALIPVRRHRVAGDVLLVPKHAVRRDDTPHPMPPADGGK